MRILLIITLFFTALNCFAQSGALVWSEEFNNESVNPDIWNYETGTGINGNWGTGQMDIATDRSENVRIQQGVPEADGGVLVITTRRETFSLPGQGTRDYTSGRINTSKKVAWGPGHRIVARVWAKDVRYPGQGFAFWMMPAEIPTGYNNLMWPQGGEIDIMEYVGGIPSANLGSVHFASQWLNNAWADGNHRHQGFYYSYQNHQVPPPSAQWVSVDLGSPNEISRVVLKWETAYAKSYELQISDDNQTWTSLFATTTANGATDDVSLAGTGRYVRVYATERGTEWGYSLFELEIYGAVGGGNLALHKTAASSSDENIELSAAKAVDGSGTTRWASGSVESPTGEWPADRDDEFAGSYGFHEYGIDWYKDRLEFFVDDYVYHVHYFKDGEITANGQDDKTIITTDDRRVGISEYSNHFAEWHPFEKKMYIILSAGVGGEGTYGGAIASQAEFPCDVYVDWIRVYQNSDAPPLVVGTETAEFELDVYPNPTGDIIFIKEVPENTSVTITDMTGKSVTTTAVHTSSVDVSMLPSGTYIITLRLRDKQVRWRFIRM
jgi:beta-glucanase (GH16 family)